MKILITDGLEVEAVNALKRKYDVDVSELSAEELLASIDGYDALIVRSRTKVTANVIGNAARMKVIGRAGVGVDNIDVATATLRKIAVVNAPAASSVSVAELTMGMMISLARRIPQADKSMKDGKWEKKRFEGSELHGKTLGLVGSGRIGAEVAARAKAFGMSVIAYDPYLSPEVARDRGIKLVDLDTVLSTSDFISIHAALTDETLGMIGADQLAKVKPGAFIVNCARGQIVQEEALVQALKSNRIAGAALDVYEKEPPTDSPFLSFENVVLTPHLGASTHEAQRRAGAVVADQVDKVLSGQRPEFLVNPEILA